MAAWLGKRVDLLLTLSVGLAGFFVYWATLAPSVLPADAGEFQFVPPIAGIAHPTGYPLYVMLGWLWSRLPVGEVAYRMNLFSALWGGICLALVCALASDCLRTLAPEAPPATRRLLGALAACLLGLSPTFWSQATMAEVYTLNAAFVAAILLLALRVARAAEPLPHLTALSWVYGLSLAHHSTTILLATAVVLAVAGSLRRLSLRRVAAAAVPGLIVPLLLYAYIPLRAPHTPYATLSLTADHPLVLYENSVRGFLDLVFAGAFGGQLAGGAIDASRLVMALDLLRGQFAWVGIGLAAIGLIGLIVRRRWALLSLTGFAYLAVVAFNLNYFIGDVYVLFIPSYLIVAVWIALGVWAAGDALYRLAGSWSVSREGYGGPAGDLRPRVMVPVALLAFALPLALAPSGFQAGYRAPQTSYASGWKEILRAPLPQGAVLVSNDRDEMMPMWYYQYVGGERADLLGLFPLIVREPGFADIGEVTDRALESGRPVFLIKAMPGLEVKYRVAPEGSVVRVLGLHTDPPGRPLDVAVGDVLDLGGFALAPDPPAAGGEVEVTLWWKSEKRLATNLSSYVHLIGPDGQTAAMHDHRPGGDYYPTSLWRPGELLVDRHPLSVPAAIEAGRYRLVAGLYEWPSMARAGDEVTLGEIVL